jgi:WD40 repeat protein
MGVVYQARHQALHRVVALKMILAGGHASEADLVRFLAEAEAVAALQHPHVVPLFEFGRHRGLPYFTLEFVAGGSLDKRLGGTPLPPLQAARLVEQLARAVYYAHERGIVHRDLKPHNVLLTEDGTPKITDFGLAKKVDVGSGLTATGAIVGTPSYMAPEQAGGDAKRVGPAADIYALGAILYECLTDRPPFRAATALETVLQVVADEPVAVRQLQPGVPRDLETICHKCLQKEPHRRYATAADLADDLAHFLKGEPIRARPASALERARKWARRRPALAASVVLSILLTGLGVAGIAWQWRQAEAARRDAAGRAEEVARANEGLEANLYLHRVALAHGEWRNNNVGRAEELLDECPPGRRRWEWDYLKRLCHTELLTLRANAGPCWGVAFSPDGRYVAGGSRVVIVWEAATGREVLRLPADFSDSGVSLAFTPDGRGLATAGSRKGVTIWDVDEAGKTPGRLGKEVLTLGRERWFTSFAFTPDGRHLATAEQEETTAKGWVRIWEVSTGKEERTLEAHGRPFGDLASPTVTSLAYSADGKRLASAGRDKAVKVWDAARGSLEHTLTGHTSAPTQAQFSADGTRLVSAGKEVKVWDVSMSTKDRQAGGRELVTLPWDGLIELSGVVFRPDGRYLASGGLDQTVRIWEVATGHEVRALRGHTQAVMHLAYSPDGKRLATASWDGTVKVWDAEAEQESRALHLPSSEASGVALSPDWRRAAFGELNGNGIEAWDSQTGRTVRRRDHLSEVTALAFSPDGRRVVSGGFDRLLKVWDTATWEELHNLEGHGDSVLSVAFHPDGRHFASGSEDKSVRLWDVDTGREVRRFVGHTDAVSGVAFSPDGRLLASTSNDTTARIWETATGRLVRRFRSYIPVSTGAVTPYCVTFSPDGRRLAVSSNALDLPGLTTVWDVESGREVAHLRGHATAVAATAFSPDGERLATCSWDGTVKLWDAATAREVLTLRGHHAPVLNVAFSRDGRQLVSLGRDGIRVWDATPLPPERLYERQAVDLVGNLFVRELLPRDEVLARLRADVSLAEPVREVALRLAETYRPDPSVLNTASWATVARPGGDPAEYTLALRRAEEACRLQPERGVYLNTLGVAQYRAGRYEAARQTLKHSEPINRASQGEAYPPDLAFLAMTYYRLGQKAEAEDVLRRLREAMRQPRFAGDEEWAGFLSEAEALLGGG